MHVQQYFVYIQHKNKIPYNFRETSIYRNGCIFMKLIFILFCKYNLNLEFDSENLHLFLHNLKKEMVHFLSSYYIGKNYNIIWIAKRIFKVLKCKKFECRSFKS